MALVASVQACTCISHAVRCALAGQRACRGAPLIIRRRRLHDTVSVHLSSSGPALGHLAPTSSRQAPITVPCATALAHRAPGLLMAPSSYRMCGH